jgi:predicted unusual protein kinase regulating ubiquinone biosynthesis (AarF/ABC1/UbiB family)
MNDLHARERHIAEVLLKQGLTQLAGALGLNGIASRRHIGGGADTVAPRNLRLALEELGPTFVKLGQMLSTRGDLLSPAYRAELAKLQDAAPAVAAAVVQHTIEQELGSEACAWLDLHPLASASIGQAHAARLHDGTEVVFDHGFFHGDPHPGNFFVQPDGSIAIIDFEIVGTLDAQLREELADLLVGLVRESPERVAAALIALGAATDRLERRALRQDLSVLLRRYSGRGVGEIAVGQAITDFLEISRRHGLRAPARRCAE